MIKTGKQLSFFQPEPRQFGGSLLKGNPKIQRPLSPKKPLHLVLKSKWTFGEKSMLTRQNSKIVDQIIRKQAKTFGVRLYHLVNVGNHLHLVVKIEDRKLYRKFIRAISGLIPRQVLKKERGPGLLRQKQAGGHSSSVQGTKQNPREGAAAERGSQIGGGSFWLLRPFTRIASWGRDFLNLKNYMLRNLLQAQKYGSRVADRIGSQVMGFDIPAVFSNTT